MSNKHYLVGPNGLLRFTAAGNAVCAPKFARAGIDIKAIRTEEQYKAASVIVGEFAFDLLDDVVERWPDTQHYRSLKECIFGDGEVDELIKLVEEFERREEIKSKLKIISNDADR